MITFEDLRARPGQPIAPLWRRLLARLGALTQVQGSAGIRIHQSPQGTVVVAEDARVSFAGAWPVTVSNQEAAVGAGTVNGLVPTIKGVALDDPKPPKLKLSESPNEKLRSWIVLKVTVDPATFQISEDEDAVTIAHVNDLKAEQAKDQWIGIHPLAMIQWKDKKTIQRTRTITYFDLQHTFVKAVKPKPSMHLFSGVGV